MKTFLKKIFLFLLVLIPFYIILINIWAYSLPKSASFNLRQISGNTFTRLQEAKKTRNIDILFLGSSHAFRSFDPRNFPNHKTFSLGTSSQTPQQTEILLHRYLNQLNPKKVVFEVYPVLFENDGIESLADILVNDKNDKYSIKAALQSKNIKIYNTLTYALVRDLLNLNSKYKEKEDKRDTYISGGYTQRMLTNNNLKIEEPQFFDLKKEQIEAFKNCLKVLKDRNIEVTLIQTPVTKTKYSSYKNIAEFNTLMSSFGLPYYDFNTLIQLNDTLDFFDSDHLNQKGVDIFNNKLIKKLHIFD